MAEVVPQYHSLEDVYGDSSTANRVVDSKHLARWRNLISRFKTTFGHAPDFVARSPGRVNIIGEHVDYSLYNVLPMAVAVDSLLAVRAIPVAKGKRAVVKISHTKPHRYAPSEFEIPDGGDIEIDPAKHEWTNYFKAGLRGTYEFLHEKGEGSFQAASMEVLVDGNVPPGGGLSSSAALVCASGLAAMAANDHRVTKQDLLDLAIVSERAVGVFSGGMDQAASIFSKNDYLLYCRFYPKFQAEHIPVPQADSDITFLMAQSFVTSEKAVTAPKHYNLRVVECTLAAVVLAKLHGVTLSHDESPLGFSLRGFQQELMKKKGHLGDTLEDQVGQMIEATAETLTREDGYSREDMSQILGLTVDELEKEYMSKFPVQADRFMLRQRALHVFREAGRVLEFKDVLTHADHLDEDKVRHLGTLMNQTQDSCRDVYDCSCPEIDEICTIARRAGAYGSRLTGAGWGGCTVHLVPQDRVEAVIDALWSEYYDRRFPKLSETKRAEAIVISKPSQGSSLITGEALTA